MSRFDNITFDNISVTTQHKLRSHFEMLAYLVEQTIKPGRAQSLVLTKLEEAYMWTGKAIRDDQIAKRGLVEFRENEPQPGPPESML